MQTNDTLFWDDPDGEFGMDANGRLTQLTQVGGSAGVNQLIRLGQASEVIDVQDVITDLTTNAVVAHPDRVDAVDESSVPGPVRSLQGHVPGPIAPTAAPRR